VATRFTSAEGSGSASTTAIVLIVAGSHAARALSPAALRFESPTVATTRARTSAAAAVAISARSVGAPVSRPTHGAGTPRRRAAAATGPSASAPAQLLATGP